MSFLLDLLVLPLLAEKQFHCFTPDNTYSFIWRVNRTWVISNSTFPDVVYITSQALSNGSTQGSLIFMAHAQVNNTDIRCFYTDGVHTVTQVNYNIVLQGICIKLLYKYVKMLMLETMMLL